MIGARQHFAEQIRIMVDANVEIPDCDQVAMMLQGLVNTGQIAGAVAITSRPGALVHRVAAGWRDREAGEPMTHDTIMRIASLSKPLTSVAALMLLEEGRFALDDPISKWAPEFRAMRVLRDPEGALDDTIAAAREITFMDLLTHRAGLTYGAFHLGPLAKVYATTLGLDLDSHLTREQWIAGLASLPLIDQPGANFHYGVSTDLLGLLIARIARMHLSEFLAERIFLPLNMSDTGFTVPAAKRNRRAKMYGFDAAGRLEHRSVHPRQAPAFLPERPESLSFVSAGAGLWSTGEDYLKFAQLFVSDGALDGVRILHRETLRRMMTNHLTEQQAADARNFGLPVFTGQGFGLGVAVVIDPDKATVTRCKGGIGTVGWPGAYGGWWQADPTDGTVLIFLAQNAFDMQQAARGVGLGVYSAISQFHGLASTRRE